jgi:hypothetical protein
LVANERIAQPKTVTIFVRQLPFLNDGKTVRRLIFEWRSPETCAKLQTTEAPDFAWECFRRNNDYREDYRTRPNTISGSMHGSASAVTDRTGVVSKPRVVRSVR